MTGCLDQVHLLAAVGGSALVGAALMALMVAVATWRRRANG